MSPSQLSRPIPASETKHLTLLEYPLWPPIEGYSINYSNQRIVYLNQNDNCRTSTGSTLWLSSQILSAYLLATLSKNVGRTKKKSRSLRAIEVGAGTGLLSITLSALNYTVLATDIEPSLTEILVPNVRNWMKDNNLSRGNILSGQLNWKLELDWSSINRAFSSDPNEELTENLNASADSAEPSQVLVVEGDGLGATWIDLIVSADTVYAVELIGPLLNTLSVLSTRSAKAPIIYLALERREPSLVNKFFDMAVEMGFRATQVRSDRLRKLVELMGWIDEDWEAVEVWKLSMIRQRRGG